MRASAWAVASVTLDILRPAGLPSSGRSLLRLGLAAQSRLLLRLLPVPSLPPSFPPRLPSDRTPLWLLRATHRIDRPPSPSFLLSFLLISGALWETKVIKISLSFAGSAKSTEVFFGRPVPASHKMHLEIRWAPVADLSPSLGLRASSLLV